MKGKRFVLHGDVDEMRKVMAANDALTENSLPEPSDNVDVQTIELGHLMLDIFSPVDDGETLLPVMVYYHAGGLVLRGREWPLIERICEFGRYIVVVPSYRLAPENPWPAALEDCVAAYEWAHSNAHGHGGDPDRMLTAGTSAGGLLAFDVARWAMKHDVLRKTLEGILALVPATVHPDGVPAELQETYKRLASHPDRRGDTVSIDWKSLRTMWAAVDFPSRSSPDIWPLTAAMSRDIVLPPTTIVYAGCDPLYGDAILMAEALSGAGTPVKTLAYPNLFHTL